jgi:predicted MPP superfamily phosphohydrolase
MIDCTLEERSLAERLKRRIEIEQGYARRGHTRRHGLLKRAFERKVERPLLKLGLSAVGLYERGRRNAVDVSTTRIRLSFADLPPAFDGFRILQISDFHIDGVDGLAEALEQAVSRIEPEPDVCVFTGDYRFDDLGDCQPVYPLMQQVVRSVRAKHGIYGILGNHDAAEMAFTLEEGGVRMLVNEAAVIGNGNSTLWLAGVDDTFEYQCDDLAGALAGVPAQAFKILLSHSPELYNEAAAAGVHLYLTGHTHAGQIRLPGIGAVKHNARCPRRMAFGAWRHYGMQGYTSAGVGCSSLPIRFHCPPELVLLELVREQPQSSEIA